MHSSLIRLIGVVISIYKLWHKSIRHLAHKERGRPPKRWTDNIISWTKLNFVEHVLTAARHTSRRKKLIAGRNAQSKMEEEKNRVPILLLTKNSRTFPGPPRRFSKTLL